MKSRKVRLVLLSLALAFFGSCVTGPSPQGSQEIYGTWINGSSNSDVQKEIITPNGWKVYHNVSDKVPFSEGSAQVVSKWTDSEGTIWYKVFLTITEGAGKGKYQGLYKLSKSATVLESQLNGVAEFDPSVGFPKKFDPSDEYYWTFAREK